MKRIFFLTTSSFLVCAIATRAQTATTTNTPAPTPSASMSAAVKNKRDSLQNAAVNKVTSDPVGTFKSLFHRNNNQPTNGVQQNNSTQASNNTQPLVGTSNVNNSPVNNVMTASGASNIAVTNPAANGNFGTISGNSKTINNGLVFSIVQCTGDKSSQTVSVTYTISNPSKPNQLIQIGNPSYSVQGGAIDANGSSLKISNVSLAGKTDLYVATDLPTGILLRGSITLINALPSSSSLQILKIPVGSQNEQGAGDKQGVMVEERNIPVAWSN